MNRKTLIKTASLLIQVSKESADEYSKNRENLINRMNEKMENRPDLNELVGVQNIEMMKDNHANHVRFMESIFYQHDAEVLVDTVLWVFRAYRSRNFSATYWSAQLNGWIEIMKEELADSTYREIYPYYNWMLINIPVFNSLAEKILIAPASAHEIRP
jgi:hypothetical protein